MKYKQFDWQEVRIQGKLTKLTDITLHIATPHHKAKKVIPYKDEAGNIFIKNPYEGNYIDFLSCDYLATGDYSKIFNYLNN